VWVSSNTRERVIKTLAEEFGGHAGAKARTRKNPGGVASHGSSRLRKWVKVGLAFLFLILAASVAFYVSAISYTPIVHRVVAVGEVVFANENVIEEWRLRSGELRDLINSGYAFRVVKEDHVLIEAKVIHEGLERLQVMVTEGPHRGREGLVIT
jgi:hypothetical protein